MFDMIFASSHDEWEYASTRNMSRIQVEQLLSSGCLELILLTISQVVSFSDYSVYLIIWLYIALGIANTKCHYIG